MDRRPAVICYVVFIHYDDVAQNHIQHDHRILAVQKSSYPTASPTISNNTRASDKETRVFSVLGRGPFWRLSAGQNDILQDSCKTYRGTAQTAQRCPEPKYANVNVEAMTKR